MTQNGLGDTQDFWTRRRAGVEAEEAEAIRQDTEYQAAEVRRALDQKPDEDVLDELGLPDPDDMKMGDDFAAFMQSTVPTRIRNRALRKLWLSNPALANLDELLDYGEDFTDSAMAVENLQTAYQVGKGMLKHILEMERQEAEDAQPDASLSEEIMAGDSQPQGSDETIDETDDHAAEDDVPVVTAWEQDPHTESAEVEELDAGARTRRRMRIVFAAGPAA